MAKKQQKAPESDAEQRQSRKDALRAQKQDRQMRSLRIAGAIILGVIALIVAIALVNELLISPGRVVATVGDTSITLREWQDRVRFERAQRIIFLENQLEAFGGDVGIVQQFGGNIISELFDHETLGQDVLNTMADEAVICQALEDRGFEITDDEIEAEIGRLYNFYGEGVSPTRPPDPTETVQPTPSLTPIPTAVITDVVPTLTPFPTATAGPTSTPVPSPTPVSLQAFEGQYNEFVGSLTEMNVDESIYRQAIRAQLCRDDLGEGAGGDADHRTPARRGASIECRGTAGCDRYTDRCRRFHGSGSPGAGCGFRAICVCKVEGATEAKTAQRYAGRKLEAYRHRVA